MIREIRQKCLIFCILEEKYNLLEGFIKRRNLKSSYLCTVEKNK